MVNCFGQKKWIIAYFWNTWVHISLQVLWEGNTFIGKEKYIFDDWWKILSFPGGVDSKSCHHSLSISDKCPQLARRNFRVTNTGKDISYMIKPIYGRHDLKKIYWVWPDRHYGGDGRSKFPRRHPDYLGQPRKKVGNQKKGESWVINIYILTIWEGRGGSIMFGNERGLRLSLRRSPD